MKAFMPVVESLVGGMKHQRDEHQLLQFLQQVQLQKHLNQQKIVLMKLCFLIR